MKENWSPQSWKLKKALHQPVYDNVTKLNKITKKMKNQFEGDYSGLSGISFLREVAKNDNKSKIKIAVNSWYPLWRMKELLPEKDKNRIEFIFNNKNNANYVFSNRIFDVDINKSKKYKLDPSFKIYKRYIVDDVTIYEVYIKR